jgi:hypothetical protein
MIKMTLLLGLSTTVEILSSVFSGFQLLRVNKTATYPPLTSSREEEGFPTTTVMAFKYILLCNTRKMLNRHQKCKTR